MRDIMEWKEARELGVYLRRTDISITRRLPRDNTFSIPIVVTAGAMNNTFNIILEVNDEVMMRTLGPNDSPS
jgi:hypothetical protein